MTAQINDTVCYQGHDYTLVGYDGTGLFDPLRHGLVPTGASSACWRGFLCAYTVDKEHLFLSTLGVCSGTPLQALLGTSPKAADGAWDEFDGVYEHLRAPVPYTGGLLVADGFIIELYVHMGFHPAWKYREVHELTFDRGRLVAASDLSTRVAEIRRERIGLPLGPSLNAGFSGMAQWVEQCFSRKYV